MSSDTSSLINETEAALTKASHAASDAVESTKQTIVKADKKLTSEAGALQSTLEGVLGGKKRFWVEGEVDGRRLANNMAGWALFGGAVHAWHRGIQKKPVFGAPFRPYIIALPVWALLGYYIHHYELRQEEVLAHRRVLLRRNRGLLEQKDFDEMNVGSAYKDQHEKKAKLMAALEKGDSAVKPIHSDSKGLKERAEESDMAKKVKELAKGGADMDVYGKKLNERLEAFEKEFEKQGKASIPTLSSSQSWVRSTWSTPEEAKAAYHRGSLPTSSSSQESSSESQGFFSSLFGKKKERDDKVYPRRLSDEEAEKLRVEMERSGAAGYGPGTGGFPPK